MVILALIAAASLNVDSNAGNSKFDATFDAPLGEKIMATSAAVGCDVTLDNESASGACSVPLQSITVDSEPTKTEHFQQWATNKNPPETWKEGIFNAPHGISYDHDGNIYVEDWNTSGRLYKFMRVGEKPQARAD